MSIFRPMIPVFDCLDVGPIVLRSLASVVGGLISCSQGMGVDFTIEEKAGPVIPTIRTWEAVSCTVQALLIAPFDSWNDQILALTLAVQADGLDDDDTWGFLLPPPPQIHKMLNLALKVESID